jgi:hypothetical protein
VVTVPSGLCLVDGLDLDAGDDGLSAADRAQDIPALSDMAFEHPSGLVKLIDRLRSRRDVHTHVFSP